MRARIRPEAPPRSRPGCHDRRLTDHEPDCPLNALLPDKDEGRPQHARLVLRLLSLRERSRDLPWWLGYLDTGSDDVVFLDAPRLSL
jgi:hypothetical protein